jgi:hypothetical protein
MGASEESMAPVFGPPSRAVTQGPKDRSPMYPSGSELDAIQVRKQALPAWGAKAQEAGRRSWLAAPARVCPSARHTFQKRRRADAMPT